MNWWTKQKYTSVNSMVAEAKNIPTSVFLAQSAVLVTSTSATAASIPGAGMKQVENFTSLL